MPPILFQWSLNKWLLLLGSIVLGFVLIALSNTRVLPLDGVHFAFFTFLTFLFALYRPGWAFLFLVALLPLETVTLIPESWFGMTLRPYQWLSVLLLLALGARFLLKKLPFALFRPRWFDYALGCIVLGGLLALLNAPDATLSFKQVLIVGSFALVYITGRIFLQSVDDIRQTLPFFFSGSVVTAVYALWQNIRFRGGLESFQVMAGRPNSTMSEADWLGLFILFCMAALWALLMEPALRHNKVFVSVFILLQTLFSLVLIIAVSRSAWLGALLALGIFLLLCFFSFKKESVSSPSLLMRLKETSRIKALIVGPFLLALVLVFSLHLTTFKLGERAGSTASGLQKITVACEKEQALPEKITALDELSPIGCRHIPLEAIEHEKADGNFVASVYRDDPNISIRGKIYGHVWEKIKEHPLLGIGWGSISRSLGTDERGAGLNASNMFFEIWLGSGIVGLIAFLSVWLALFGVAILGIARNTWKESDMSLAVFIVTAWVGITVFNLFNSGILLGFFFLYLSIGALLLEKRGETNN